MTQIISNVVKEYPHMYKIIIWHNDFKFEVGNMPIKNIDLDPSISSSETFNNKNDDVLHDNAQRSLRRTKTNVEDIVLCNKFDLWCTFTFDKRRVDRYDANRCKSIIRMWLHNQRSHSPHLKYIIVPEYHKKCEECIKLKEKVCIHTDRPKAIHFHALIANYNGKLKLAKSKKTNKQLFDKSSKTEVYNISSFRSGFSKAVKLYSDGVLPSINFPKDNTELSHKRSLVGCSAIQSARQSHEAVMTAQSPHHYRDSSDQSLLHKSDINQGSSETYYKLASYLTKYITKEMPQLTGGNRYFCSTNLNRPKKTVNGLGLLNLNQFIRHRKPVYIDDVMEIQCIRKDEVAISALPGVDSFPASQLPGVVPSVIYNQG